LINGYKGIRRGCGLRARKAPLRARREIRG
jgi:hypothetical protein